MKADRPTILVRLRPEPHVADVDMALRRALKALLRSYGLRCVAIETIPESEAAA